MTAVKTESLTKKYRDKTVVKGLNLTIKKGEMYALLGVNGAGKTTTIKMLSCLIKPTSGDGYIFSNSIVSDSNAVKQIISVSPQETSVAVNLTVKENLEFIAGVFGFSKANAKRKAQVMIDEFDMRDVENTVAKKLSGGYMRRLSIAMALITEPSVLFLDEPTLGLDVLARRDLWRQIEKLKGKITIILTTHYLEEAEALADCIGIMAKGELRAEGTAEKLKALADTDSFEEAFVRIAEGEV